MHDGSIDSPQSSTWVCTINTDGTGLHYLYESHGNPQFTPDGTKIILGIDDYGFKILDAELGTVLVDLDTLSNFSHYAISEDNTICFSASSPVTNSRDLFLFESTNSSITNITMTDSILENDPYFSNNGEKIIFLSIGILAELIMYDFIEQQFTIISSSDFYVFPQFSYDESQIIYNNLNSYNLININGQNNMVTFEGNLEFYPCSIFGNEMTFSADSHIWKMNIDGSELMDLGEGFHPQFSPDGSKIACDGLHVMNNDANNKQNLTDEVGEYPHFSPDGSKIVFIMERYEDE